MGAEERDDDRLGASRSAGDPCVKLAKIGFWARDSWRWTPLERSCQNAHPPAANQAVVPAVVVVETEGEELGLGGPIVGMLVLRVLGLFCSGLLFLYLFKGLFKRQGRGPDGMVAIQPSLVLKQARSGSSAGVEPTWLTEGSKAAP